MVSPATTVDVARVLVPVSRENLKTQIVSQIETLI
jgi:hypothetical protein